MAELWPLPADPLDDEVDAAADALALAELYRTFDRAPAFPSAIFQGLGARRLLGLTVPEAAGGRGLSARRAAAVLFRLAYRGGTTAAKLSLQPEFCSVLLHLGTPSQVDRWFRPIVRGELLVGNQITEPDAGSDVRALGTTASRSGSGYVLNGTKSEAAFAADASAALVYARLPTERGSGDGVTAFLVPQDAPGVRRVVDPPDMGERWQRRGSVVYQEVPLDAEARVGPEGGAFAALVRELVRERALLAAIYLGVARASLDETVAYVGMRKAFGRRLADNQAIAFPLLEIATELEGAWRLTETTADRLDRGADAAAQTALLKSWASRAALRALDLALQFHGGRGYSSRTPHEQRYRDVRSGAIAHGPSEVLQQAAARVLWPKADPPRPADRRPGSGPGAGKV